MLIWSGEKYYWPAEKNENNQCDIWIKGQFICSFSGTQRAIVGEPMKGLLLSWSSYYDLDFKWILRSECPIGNLHADLTSSVNKKDTQDAVSRLPLCKWKTDGLGRWWPCDLDLKINKYTHRPRIRSCGLIWAAKHNLLTTTVKGSCHSILVDLRRPGLW